MKMETSKTLFISHSYSVSHTNGCSSI